MSHCALVESCACFPQRKENRELVYVLLRANTRTTTAFVDLTRSGQVPSGTARGVVGRHWNEEATTFSGVASWTKSRSFLSIYWRHLLQSVSDSAKTAHGRRQASVCSTQLGNCYEDKWYTSHQISTLAASSGLAERFVQTMKWALCSSEGRASVHECLNNFSLSYGNSLYTGKASPARLMFSQQLVTCLIYWDHQEWHMQYKNRCKYFKRRDSQKALGEVTKIPSFKWKWDEQQQSWWLCGPVAAAEVRWWAGFVQGLLGSTSNKSISSLGCG